MLRILFKNRIFKAVELVYPNEFKEEMFLGKRNYWDEQLIKEEIENISKKTIYNYIDEGLFPNLTNKDLPVKKNGKKRKYDNIRTAINNTKGTSISERDGR